MGELLHSLQAPPSWRRLDFISDLHLGPDTPRTQAALLAALPGLKTVWMQLGVENAEAAALAEARGLTVVQNRCPAIEIPRLGL